MADIEKVQFYKSGLIGMFIGLIACSISSGIKLAKADSKMEKLEAEVEAHRCAVKILKTENNTLHEQINELKKH